MYILQIVLYAFHGNANDDSSGIVTAALTMSTGFLVRFKNTICKTSPEIVSIFLRNLEVEDKLQNLEG